MKQPITHVFLLSICFLLTACAGIGDKFSPSKVVDISIFSDNTIAMIRDLDIATERSNTIYIREYLKYDEPEEQALSYAVRNTNELLQRITEYSIQIVTFSESSMTKKEKIASYYEYMKPLALKMQQDLNLEVGYYDKTLEEIQQADSYLEALNNAQPIVNGVSQRINQLSNLTIDSIETVIAKVDQSIELEFSEVIQYQEVLEYEKYQILKGIGYTYEAFRGDKESYKKLRSSNVILDKKLIPVSFPSNEKLVNIRDHLLTRLEILHTIGNEIAPDWEVYRASLVELNEASTKAITATNKIRIMAILWVRAHNKMSAGKTKPAEWFDINDAPAQLLKLAL